MRLRLVLIITAVAAVSSWAPPAASCLFHSTVTTVQVPGLAVTKRLHSRSCHNNNNNPMGTRTRTTTTSSSSSLTQLYSSPQTNQRRDFLQFAVPFLVVTAQQSPSTAALALVKGVAPPPPKGTKGTTTSDKPKCTNVDDCQALAEQREQLLKEAEEQGPPPQVTRGGTRYRDIVPGTGDVQVQSGDQVTLFFKVLKLGKRSYDGISGEGTVVFSRGECVWCILLCTVVHCSINESPQSR